MSPDGCFIGADRRLYVPFSQSRRTRLFGNSTDLTRKPLLVHALTLPQFFDGIPLRDAVTGRPTSTAR